MQSKPAIKSKTIGFNTVVLGIIALLAAFDIDVPNEVYQAILAGVPLFNLILRFVTKGAITLTSNPSGNASGKSVLPILVLLCLLCAGAAGIGLVGCAPGQSVTQQISSQTEDPGLIALATFADAQDAYIHAQELYLPYQAVLQQSRPDLDAAIIGYFREAEKILSRWEQFGDVPINDKARLREYVRRITLQAARMMESK